MDCICALDRILENACQIITIVLKQSATVNTVFTMFIYLHIIKKTAKYLTTSNY